MVERCTRRAWQSNPTPRQRRRRRVASQSPRRGPPGRCDRDRASGRYWCLAGHRAAHRRAATGTADSAVGMTRTGTSRWPRPASPRSARRRSRATGQPDSGRDSNARASTACPTLWRIEEVHEHALLSRQLGPSSSVIDVRRVIRPAPSASRSFEGPQWVSPGSRTSRWCAGRSAGSRRARTHAVNVSMPSITCWKRTECNRSKECWAPGSRA